MKPESVTPASEESTVTMVDSAAAAKPMAAAVGGARPMMSPAPAAGGAAPFAKPTAPVIGRAGVTWSRERAPNAAPGGGDAPTESKKLIVGREIVLSGQITSCDRLVVEGRVEASLTESRVIEIAETGHFKGSAEIESAEIAGRYEGTLTVRERLFIRSTGKVNGKVTYGQIEIEPGGEIAGEVHVGPRRSGSASE
ncbi:MAG TPA: polymer-forming cytoskeletal protein [Rhizomicrobium sp.]|nr:polymer-forming cytoskeletal protein [Alphaproteobacteria bacterium]HUO88802.1 polymer-forming cytoskeletal protein [Rhizomicrobium sp.]